MTKVARIVAGFIWSLFLFGLLCFVFKPEWVVNPEMLIFAFIGCIFATVAWWKDLK